jgi:hypothetical protein
LFIRGKTYATALVKAPSVPISMHETRNTDAHKECLRKVIALLAGL